MFYRRRASPKHRYNTIEEDYGGGGAPHTAKRSKGSIVVLSRCAPLPPYIKEQGGGEAGQEEACQGGVLLLLGVGLPPFLVQLGEGEGRERGEGGAAPPSLSNSD